MRHAWRRWKVAIKATEDGEELFLVTLHLLQPGDYRNIVEGGALVRRGRGSQRITPLFSSAAIV